MVIVQLGGTMSDAQNPGRTHPTECPKVSILEPAGVSAPGDLIRFAVTVDPEPANMQFEWATNIGKVDEGQRTKRIGIRYLDEMKGTTLVVTVKVLGLPGGCSNTSSAGTPIHWHSEGELVSQFSVPASSIHTRHLERAVVDLNKYPNNQMYIIEYFPYGTSEAAIKRKRDRIKAFMAKTLKFDVDRITFVTADAERPLTKIYRIPPGASNPTP